VLFTSCKMVYKTAYECKKIKTIVIDSFPFIAIVFIKDQIKRIKHIIK